MTDFYHDENGHQIQAMLLSPELVTVISVWCGGVVVEEIDPFDVEKRYPALNVPTSEGPKRASLGDYVIKHEDKTFGVVKPNKFQHSYKSGE
jgi:hypothetical protein